MVIKHFIKLVLLIKKLFAILFTYSYFILLVFIIIYFNLFIIFIVINFLMFYFDNNINLLIHHKNKENIKSQKHRQKQKNYNNVHHFHIFHHLCLWLHNIYIHIKKLYKQWNKVYYYELKLFFLVEFSVGFLSLNLFPFLK